MDNLAQDKSNFLTEDETKSALLWAEDVLDLETMGPASGSLPGCSNVVQPDTASQFNNGICPTQLLGSESHPVRENFIEPCCRNENKCMPGNQTRPLSNSFYQRVAMGSPHSASTTPLSLINFQRRTKLPHFTSGCQKINRARLPPSRLSRSSRKRAREESLFQDDQKQEAGNNKGWDGVEHVNGRMIIPTGPEFLIDALLSMFPDEVSTPEQESFDAHRTETRPMGIDDRRILNNYES